MAIRSRGPGEIPTERADLSGPREDRLVDSRFAGEIAASHCLVDDHYRLGVLRVARVETASLDESGAHGFEIALADRVMLNPGEVLSPRLRRAGSHERIAPSVLQGQEVRAAHRPNARLLAKQFEELRLLSAHLFPAFPARVPGR